MFGGKASSPALSLLFYLTFSLMATNQVLSNPGDCETPYPTISGPGLSTTSDPGGGIATGPTEIAGLQIGPVFNGPKENGSVPADASCAAGPSQVVVTVNNLIVWYDKDGVVQSSTTLGSFFASLSPQGSFTDPRVLYDSFANRFVITAITRRDSPQASEIFLAVSLGPDLGPDANGGWYKKKVSGLVTIDGRSTWADFPALGVDSDGLYLTSDQFTFQLPNETFQQYKGPWLRIIPKEPLYSGGNPAIVAYDLKAFGAINASAMPTIVIGSPSGGLRNFMVQYSRLQATTFPNEAVKILAITGTITSPVFSAQTIPVGNIDDLTFFTVPQPDTPAASCFLLKSV